MDLTRYDKLRSAIRRTLSPDEADVANVASQSDNHYTLPASSFRLFLKRPIFSKDFFTV
mgnify:CR=1 FL=1